MPDPTRPPPAGLPPVRLLIAGEWVETAERGLVLDKYHLRPLSVLHTATPREVRAAVDATHAAFEDDRLSPAERGAILDRAAGLLEQRQPALLELLRDEAGFTPADARGELQRAAMTLRLTAEEARRLTGEMLPLDGAPQQAGRLGFTLRVPLGVVLAVTPFNAPLNTVAHKIGPALAAGNAVILKPSPHTPALANALAQVLLDAGLPPGLLAVLHGGAEVVQALLDDARIRFVAFTGSTEAGQAIQRGAGLRRTQMELGSIAFTILADDADLGRALPRVLNAGYRKAGQVCTSVQLLLVHRSLRTRVEEWLAQRVRALPFGDPALDDTVVGPVISEAAAQRIDEWIDQAVAGGARRLAGGRRVGAVVPPTLLADLPADTPVACREVFGPVMGLLPYDTLDEAIARVNATPYGLATGLFTNRLDDALRAARRLQVGGVHVNETSSSRVDLMPYGGTKASGFGREGPAYAIREMSEERVVTLAASG